MSSTQTSVQSGSQVKSRKRSPLVVIFFTIFIDLIGFGIIIPTSPFIAREFGANALQIGLLLTVYSFMQFLFSPVWGMISDRIGRRPTILITLLGGSLSYFIFAFGRSLAVLFFARGLAGMFGGNISTAHAYIGDVTPPEERSKGMGLIGAAFGLGFIFGPLLGGGLGLLGKRLGAEPPFGLSFSAFGVGVLCLLNFAFAYLALKESLSPEVRARGKAHGDLAAQRFGDGPLARFAAGVWNRFATIAMQARRPIAGWLMGVYFLTGFAMAAMEAMLIPFVADEYGWGLRQTTLGFVYIGVITVLTQGWLIRKWVPKFGERKILAVGAAMFALSLVGIGVSGSIAQLALAMTVLAIGNSMMRPPNLGMISLLTPAEEQGVSMGVTNSLSSLGRILGPIAGGMLYEHLSRAAPFLGSGLAAGVSFVVVVWLYRSLPSSGRGASAGSAHA